MKFFKIFIVLTLLFVLWIPNFGLSKKRNLSTPLSRLVGHWQDSLGFEYYFSPIDSTTMTGSLVRVVPEKEEKMMEFIEGMSPLIDKSETASILKFAGKAIYYQYKILSQVPNGQEVQIAILLPSKDFSRFRFFPLPKEVTFNVKKDGKRMNWSIGGHTANKLTNPIKYVDSKTSPEEE